MEKFDKFLSLATVKKIFKKFGGRIGLNGYLELQKNTKNYAELVAKLAVKNALYEGRRIVKDSNIKEALEELKETRGI